MAGKNNKSIPAIWEPLRDDMLSFKKSIDQQFDSFFLGHPFVTTLPSLLRKEFSSWKPEINMYETGKNVIVQADIPGCDKKDVSIKIENNILTISGEKKEEKEIRKRNFYHKEQRRGSFYRSVGLPSYIDLSRPAASYEKGVLKVEFPKVMVTNIKQKKIEIKGK